MSRWVPIIVAAVAAAFVLAACGNDEPVLLEDRQSAVETVRVFYSTVSGPDSSDFDEACRQLTESAREYVASVHDWDRSTCVDGLRQARFFLDAYGGLTPGHVSNAGVSICGVDRLALDQCLRRGWTPEDAGDIWIRVIVATGKDDWPYQVEHVIRLVREGDAWRIAEPWVPH